MSKQNDILKNLLNMYDNDDDDEMSFGSVLLPEESEVEDKEESVIEEDEVQINHDPELSSQMVSVSSNSRSSNHRKITYVMRRKTMTEVVQIPGSHLNRTSGERFSQEAQRNSRECFIKKGRCQQL